MATLRTAQRSTAQWLIHVCLSPCSGECFYYLGVEDDGYPRGLEHQELQDSIAVIHRMAVSLQVSSSSGSMFCATAAAAAG